MTIEPTDIVEQGRSAWERLRSRRRATRDEWLDVGGAIIIGRTEALKSANTNRASARRGDVPIAVELRRADVAGMNVTRPS